MHESPPRIAIVLGGPSEERGISLNSARTIADHVAGMGARLAEIVYFDAGCVPFSIADGLLYCNTTSDFDYKLHNGDGGDGTRLTRDELLARLRGVDLVFPAIHGRFGEDGQLQALLERAGVPYVGTGPEQCAIAFDKFRAKTALAEAGLTVVSSTLATSEHTGEERARLLDAAYARDGGVVLKPAQSGSSIDVHVLPERERAGALLDELIERHERVLIQPRMVGVEYTTSVLEGPDGPVALMPTEVELRKMRDERDHLDFERKYRYSDKVHFHCPPRVARRQVEAIQRLAERTFATLGLRDFARIDGWLLDDGSFAISDVNPISGMDQTSFLFVQAAQAGMDHGDVFRFLARRAAARAGASWPSRPLAAVEESPRRRLPILFGGTTAERQVSVMSGLNVWLKLQDSTCYAPEPYLLASEDEVWRLPYAAALHHSVEEIVSVCENAAAQEPARAALAAQIHERLALGDEDASVRVELPERIALERFLDGCDLVFVALHGGFGEDGRLQALLDEHGVRYNGSGPDASRLCMDKAATGEAVAALGDPHVLTARRVRLPVPESVDGEVAAAMWRAVVERCGEDAIVKPPEDGCSAGIVRLRDAAELRSYLQTLVAGRSELDGHGFQSLPDDQTIEMPMTPQQSLLFEEFVETDDVVAVQDGAHGRSTLRWGDGHDTGWVEVTVGVIGPRGQMRALNPSVTLADNKVLSIQEKFMSGTGINLTPPPPPPAGRVDPEAVLRARRNVERVAEALGLEGYARIDAFMQRERGDVIVIEANTLPALSPATVFYHQAIAERPPIAPRAVLERIVELAERSPVPSLASTRP